MAQQLSDAELEIMKIVWGNQSEVTLFSYIMDGLAASGRPCQKNTLIVLLSRLMNKGFLSARKIGRRNEYTTLVSDLIMGDLLADGEYEELKGMLEKGRGNNE